MKRITVISLTIFATLLLMFGCDKLNQISMEAEKPKAPEVKKEAGTTIGITDTEIKIGTWGPLTGPAALWGAIPRGMKTYFEMINTRGGIHGRKLNLLIRDDSYQPPKTKAAVMELVEKEGVFAFVGGVGTGTGMAVMDYLTSKNIPWIGPASGSSKWTHPVKNNVFSLYPTYRTEARALVRYLTGEAGKQKIAFFYQNDDYGKEGLEAATEELKSLGKELVAEVSVEITDTDLSSHVLKLKEAAPDAVMLWLLPKQAAITLGTAAKLDFKPQWATTSTLSDAPLMYGITKGLWEGVIYNSIMELPDSDTNNMKSYRDAYEKYALAENSDEKFGVFFLAGFLFAEPFVEALEKAGRDLTREKLVDALESLNKWQGGIGGEVTFAGGERQGQKSVFITRVEGGKGVKMTDWIKIED